MYGIDLGVYSLWQDTLQRTGFVDHSDMCIRFVHTIAGTLPPISTTQIATVMVPTSSVADVVSIVDNHVNSTVCF